MLDAAGDQFRVSGVMLVAVEASDVPRVQLRARLCSVTLAKIEKI